MSHILLHLLELACEIILYVYFFGLLLQHCVETVLESDSDGEIRQRII